MQRKVTNRIHKSIEEWPLMVRKALHARRYVPMDFSWAVNDRHSIRRSAITALPQCEHLFLLMPTGGVCVNCPAPKSGKNPESPNSISSGDADSKDLDFCRTPNARSQTTTTTRVQISQNLRDRSCWDPRDEGGRSFCGPA